MHKIGYIKYSELPTYSANFRSRKIFLPNGCDNSNIFFVGQFMAI